MNHSSYYMADNADIESEKQIAAKNLFQAGDYNGALKVYLDMLKTSGISYKLYYDIGRCYYRIGNIDEAENYFKNSIMIENTKNLSYIYLGNIEFHKDNLSNAIEYWMFASVHNPDDENICRNLATSYFTKDMKFQSALYYLKYLKYSKDKKSNYYIDIQNSLLEAERNCQDFYKKTLKSVSMNDKETAIDGLKYALDKYPLNFDMNCLLGKTFLSDKKYTEALKYLNQAYCIDSKSTDILEMLSVNNIALRDYSTAYCCLKRMLRLAIGHQKMYLEIIQNIHKIEPVLASNSYEKHLTKAEEYYTNNDYQMALFEYENTIILNPILAQKLGGKIELLKKFINPEIDAIKISLEKGGIYYSEKDYRKSNKYFSKVMLLADERSTEYKIAKTRLVNV